jgi:hypothetical protein
MLREEIIHFILSLFTGIIIAAIYNNYWAVVATLIGGFLVDADHLFDYFVNNKFSKFSLTEFFSAKYFDESGKVYIPLHSFEIAAILIIIGNFSRQFNWLFYSLGISLAVHLIYDTFHNKPRLPTYFLFYRVLHGFRHVHFEFRENLISEKIKNLAHTMSSGT